MNGTRWTVALLLLVSSACAGSAGTGAVRPQSVPGAVDYDSLYAAHADSMRSRFSEADVQFVTGMIAHHAQALEMSRLAETNGAGSQVRILAARIINGQQDEIATMQQWLRDRGQPVPSVDAAGGMSGDHAGHAMMPGMLTPQQMVELAAARGSNFDRLFLTGMIQHHRGAVTMVSQLFDTDGALMGDETFKLASDIQADQRSEIARMERMLEALP